MSWTWYSPLKEEAWDGLIAPMPRDPDYCPYPYPPSWKRSRTVCQQEADMFADPESHWMYLVTRLGGFMPHQNNRVWQAITYGIALKQAEARKALEDEALARPTPPVPGGVDDVAASDIVFMTADGRCGLPVKMLLTGRRALERGMRGPKVRCFENWPNDTEWVRIQWPAYPDHEPTRHIVVSKRMRSERPRRPVTRLELVVALAGVITQYYAEVTKLEPAPAFAHLALGPAEGCISLYELRLMYLRPAPDGVFDIVLELDTEDESAPPPAAEGSSVKDASTSEEPEDKPRSLRSQSPIDSKKNIKPKLARHSIAPAPRIYNMYGRHTVPSITWDSELEGTFDLPSGSFNLRPPARDPLEARIGLPIKSNIVF
ncbi:hypothetical protein VTO73DRAFT_14230 [Trametes versicolor]